MNLLGFVAAGAIALAAAGAWGFSATRRPPKLPVASNAVAERVIARQSVEAEPVSPPPDLAPTPEAQQAQQAQQEPPSAAASASTSASAASEAPAPPAASVQPNAAAFPQPSEADVQAALHATPIVMYSTSWCAVCVRARAFLDANRLRRIEHDIDTDERARADLRRLTGKLSVPTFLVDGVMVGPGFSEAGMKRALVASVEKRLGVRGIEARPGAAF